MLVQKKQRGLIHNLILPALVLTGIVLAGWSQMINKNQTGVNIARSVDDSRAQLKKIQTALNWCQVVYPSGNNGKTYAPGSESHAVLPASPDGGGWMPVRQLVCPGVPTKTLWAATGDMLPLSGLYLGDWEYLNNDSGVYLRISVESPGNEYGQAVLKQISTRLHPDQFKIVNGGDTLQVLYAP